MQDISASIQHVRREWGLSEKHVIIWGHSAGANLTSGAAFWDKEERVFSIGLQILDYPYMDTYLKANERKRNCQSVSGKLMDTFAHYYTEEEKCKKSS